MSAPWCQDPEPHGEHYEPMPVGYADMASVCFGRPSVCPYCHGTGEA